jgi:N-acetylglucosamine kinase-like BadF-type ATPase
MSIHFIGVDAGATATRALMATASGVVVGRGRAAGANGWSSGTSPADAIAAAVEAALGAHAPATVANGVIGVAGAVSSVPEHAAAVARAWAALGISQPPRIILDVVTAYAAGTTLPRGLVLAAGTGAIAGLVDDGVLARRAGGRGWLVGDEGSAVWLGVEGVRATLLALDERGPATALSQAIPAAFEIDEADLATAITDTVYSRSPAELGQLAPLVLGAAEAGDAVAVSLVEAAVEHLAGTAMAAAGDERPEVVVLAGSLLTRVPAIGQRVRARLTLAWPRASFVESVSGEAGATALAIRWHTGKPVSTSVLRALRAGATD